jgi:chemotaxis protein methyltransferase CheR
MTLATNSARARSGPVITEEEFAKFCEFFYRKTGILFDSSKKYFVDRRLAERMQKNGCRTFHEYFASVRFDVDGAEFQGLVNEMTVNETYFFREDYQFQALVSGILPEIAASRTNPRPIRIWSMPCSSGEEPYSLAIYILEHWSDADRFDIEIMGSDIDSAILAKAVAGTYGERSLQRLSPEIRRKYFTAKKDGEYQICDDIRGSIDFSRVNITDPQHMRQFREIDVIFCRNLLIYFDDKSRLEAVEAMYDCLTPGGYICLGHSESMSRISSLFRPKKFTDAIIYQKPVEAKK